MELRDDFEPVHGKLLCRILLPTLDKVVFELVREKTRLQTLRSQHSHTILVAHPLVLYLISQSALTSQSSLTSF